MRSAYFIELLLCLFCLGLDQADAQISRRDLVNCDAKHCTSGAGSLVWDVSFAEVWEKQLEGKSSLNGVDSAAYPEFLASE
ncbi:hypothetical protein [Dyadobacter sp. SG02]|uniref:hypothetical protein n=1 Tax=Dyadobacter sp. SG02 TaxID=1855291 RepID=UPI00115FE949|nr:hypothetical protein [Dyadobacter sp. SG02]